MPLSVGDLLGLPGLGLKLVAGAAGVDRAVRWVHTSELEDPTPWLNGGELLLTTGMALKGSPALQRSYLQRLVAADLAGLGFGVGFGFDEVPRAIVRAADKGGFPILEVPYPVPFIAISEAVSSGLSEDRVRDAQMSVEVHERLAALVSGGSGPADVLDEVVSLAGGWALLFDIRGHLIARSVHQATDPLDPRKIWEGLPRGLVERRGPTTSADMGPRGAQVGLAVVAGKRHEGVLVFGKGRRLEGRDRIVVRHAVTVLGLLLASRRAVIEAERRIAGDILADAFEGRTEGDELERRLELVGFSPGRPVTAVVVEIPTEIDAGLLEDLVWTVDAALGLRFPHVRTLAIGGRIAALVVAGDRDALASGALQDVIAAAAEDGVGPDALRVAVGEPVATSAARHSYLTAVFALRAAPESRRIVTPHDLGSYGFLLGARPTGVLEGYVRSVLGSLMDRDQDKDSELVTSVRAFIAAGGRWEPGAAALGVHRHTLRYRVRQAEELLGRDLSRAEDRLEVWLALKALELLEG